MLRRFVLKYNPEKPVPTRYKFDVIVKYRHLSFSTEMIDGSEHNGKLEQSKQTTTGPLLIITSFASGNREVFCVSSLKE